MSYVSHKTLSLNFKNDENNANKDCVSAENNENSVNKGNSENIDDTNIDNNCENKHQSSSSVDVPENNEQSCRSLSPVFFSSSCSDCDFNIRFVRHYIKQNKHLKYDRILRTAKRTIYTAGRPPWYNTQGQSKESFLIG